ncbi:MAG: glycine zipper 2TM domain-containing protein [Pseudomonadota bacterium]|nr:glycine zipper 2TM domain-containing protein [Pseudomonadota bacterium]
MKNNTLAIALASLLVGGVAVAAFQNNREQRPDFVAAGAENDYALGLNADGRVNTRLDGDVRLDNARFDNGRFDNEIPARGRVEYANVVDIDPITEKQQLYAQVIGTDPIRETSTTSTPREVCEDVVVQERMPERDGNVGGTVAGAVLGGLIGNQVGGGNGKKLATVAGAVGGGFAGRAIDRRHVGGQVVARTDRQCRTVSSTSQSSRVTGYNVSFRNPDGTTGTQYMGSKPGSRIALGTDDKVVGYNVTYRYAGDERTIRMDQKPGDRLPVIDGQVVTQVAAAEGDDRG